MVDLYCPACGLVLYARRLHGFRPTHCPRCRARRRGPIALVPLNESTEAAPRSPGLAPRRARARPSCVSRAGVR